MKLSIHPDIKGKPVRHQPEGQKPYYVCDGKTINLGYGWLNVEVESWRDAFELITTDGYATSSELTSDHRTDENYISRQICMVDIDDGMTIQQLFTDEFYNEYGAGFYTTASHTDDNHRFRIMFVLEEPEQDPLRMRKIIRSLLEQYKSADRNCKDASRIYYGIPNCVIKEYTNKILPKVAVDVLVEMIDNIDREEELTRPFKFYNYDEKAKYDEQFVDELLVRINTRTGSLKGEYDLWKTIAWSVCHTIGVHNAEVLMMRYWSVKTKKEINTLRDWKPDRSPTIGTLIKMSGIDKETLKKLDLEFKARNNIETVLSPYQASFELKRKIKVW